MRFSAPSWRRTSDSRRRQGRSRRGYAKAIDSYAYALLPSLAKLNGQIWSTLIGAGVGAVVGGLVTLCIQFANLRVMRRQEAAAQEKRDLATVTAMLLKAAKMFSTINHIDTHLRAAVEHARQDGSARNPPWQMVPPMVGKTPEITFSDDERMLAVVDMPKDFIAVLEIPDIRNSLIDLVDEYSRWRVELAGLMPAVSSEGTLATTELTADEYQRLTPRMLNLQSLIDPMIQQAANARTDAITVFDLIKADGNRRFGAAFPRLELDARQVSEGGRSRAPAR